MPSGFFLEDVAVRVAPSRGGSQLSWDTTWANTGCWNGILEFASRKVGMAHVGRWSPRGPLPRGKQWSFPEAVVTDRNYKFNCTQFLLVLPPLPLVATFCRWPVPFEGGEGGKTGISSTYYSALNVWLFFSWSSNRKLYFKYIWGMIFSCNTCC